MDHLELLVQFMLYLTMENPQKDPKTLSIETLKRDDVPFNYTNGFIINTSHSDAALIFFTNGKPTQVLNMSFTNAKSLAKKLTSMIEDFERKAEMEIKTVDEIRSSISKNTKK